MKKILGFLDPNNYYKLVLDDTDLKNINTAHNLLDNCPFNGELWIDVYALHLNTQKMIPCKILVTEHGSLPMINDQPLLEHDDYLSTIPDIWLTRTFRVMQSEALNYLSQSEIDLVNMWNEVSYLYS